MELKINPTFQTLIPPLTDEEYEQLKQNIVADGCREPIVVWDGTIIDGHNRYRICTETGIEFQTVDKQLEDEDDAVKWIILNQFGRRNLTLFQRAELADRLRPLLREKAREKQLSTLIQNSTVCPALDKRGDDKIEKLDTLGHLAKIAGIGRGTMHMVDVIRKKGTEEQIERARKGGSRDNTVNAVYKEIKEAEKAQEPAQAPDAAEIYAIDGRKLTKKEEQAERESQLYGIGLDRYESTVEDLKITIEMEGQQFVDTIRWHISTHARQVFSREDDNLIAETLSDIISDLKKIKGGFQHEKATTAKRTGRTSN